MISTSLCKETEILEVMPVIIVAFSLFDVVGYTNKILESVKVLASFYCNILECEALKSTIAVEFQDQITRTCYYNSSTIKFTGDN